MSALVSAGSGRPSSALQVPKQEATPYADEGGRCVAEYPDQQRRDHAAAPAFCRCHACRGCWPACHCHVFICVCVRRGGGGHNSYQLACSPHCWDPSRDAPMLALEASAISLRLKPRVRCQARQSARCEPTATADHRNSAGAVDRTVFIEPLAPTVAKKSCRGRGGLCEPMLNSSMPFPTTPLPRHTLTDTTQTDLHQDYGKALACRSKRCH